MQQRNNIIMR